MSAVSESPQRRPSHLDADRATEMLRQMLRIRGLEEKAAELYSLGKIRGFLHLYIGEEAVAVGAMPVLGGEDAVVTTYREHGQAILRGISMRSVMAEMFGKASGCSRGRGGSMHLFDAERRFYGGNAIVAGGLPMAVGLALADRMQHRQRVTACFFGDGAVAEGEFHESMNLAALWQLPVLFFCENNLYAMGTALHRHQAMTELYRKADAYAIRSSVVDGMDVVAVREATRAAADYVRNGNGPYLLEARTYRFRAHSMYDPELYRPREEVERWKERDPITTFAARLRQWEWIGDDQQADLERQVAAEIDDAIEFAEQAPLEPIEALTTDVYTPTAERQERSPS